MSVFASVVTLVALVTFVVSLVLEVCEAAALRYRAMTERGEKQ